MYKYLITYCSILLFLLAGEKLEAQVYSLSDQVFIDYLKNRDSNLINANDELVISNIPLANIESIALPNAGLTNMDGIQFFTDVVEIDVKNNNISEVPDLNNLVQLKILNLSYNKIDLFNSVSMLKALETLDLSRNQISIFPTFHADVALKDLNLNNNNLNEVLNFSKANNLRILDVSNNKITDLQVFSVSDFPVLEELNIGFNMLYFDDYTNLPVSEINKENQDVVTLQSPDTLYLGDTLKLDMGFDSHLSNFHVLIKRPTLFELADSYTEELSWVISDTSQSGTYYVETTNSFYTSNYYRTEDFSFVVLERPEEEEPEVDPEIDPEVDPEVDPELNIDFQNVIIPDGTLDEQSVYIDGDGEATVFNKAGEVYFRFDLPFEWNGSNSNGVIIPGYYVIKLEENNYMKITVIH